MFSGVWRSPPGGVLCKPWLHLCFHEYRQEGLWYIFASCVWIALNDLLPQVPPVSSVSTERREQGLATGTLSVYVIHFLSSSSPSLDIHCLILSALCALCWMASVTASFSITRFPFASRTSATLASLTGTETVRFGEKGPQRSYA